MKVRKKVFEDVTLEYGGARYRISADQVFKAICAIEREITLIELFRMAAAGDAYKLAQVASGYATALRFAGAQVEDDEVYEAMFGDSDIPELQAIVRAVSGLIEIMTPPDTKKAAAAASTNAAEPAGASLETLAPAEVTT